MERAKLNLEQSEISIAHANNTLIITVSYYQFGTYYQPRVSSNAAKHSVDSDIFYGKIHLQLHACVDGEV